VFVVLYRMRYCIENCNEATGTRHFDQAEA